MNRLSNAKPEDVKDRLVLNNAERLYLRKLAAGPLLRDRRRCLNFLEHRILAEANMVFCLEVLDSLIPDPRQDVRWKAFIVLGELIPEHSSRVWPFVVKYGSHRGSDIRSAVACCLLEHILEYDYDTYLPLIKELIGMNALYADTLGTCYRFGQAGSHGDEIDALVAAPMEQRRRRAHQRNLATRRRHRSLAGQASHKSGGTLGPASQG
jgi:hypothetical protein